MNEPKGPMAEADAGSGHLNGWRVSAFELNAGGKDRVVMADDGFGVAWIMGRTAREHDEIAQQIIAAPELLLALKETWRVLRAAGLQNLTRGVQLGQTSWYVKISDAEALSDRAIALASTSRTDLGEDHV